jgi:hypothetical protein
VLVAFCAENDSGSSDIGRTMRGVGQIDDEEEGPSYQGLDGESYEAYCEAPSSRRAMVRGQAWASRWCSGEALDSG